MEQRLHQIQEIVQTAKQNTPIYQEKYKEIDISNFTWETFQSLPYLTREEYRNRAQINDLYCPTEESHYVFISGGSTGISKASFWNISDIEIATTTLANTMKQLHLDNKDRALNLEFTRGCQALIIVLIEPWKNWKYDYSIRWRHRMGSPCSICSRFKHKCSDWESIYANINIRTHLK